MARLYLFRGKSATGKTTITNALSKELNVCVLRKDDIFDPLSRMGWPNAENNSACYDILANMIMQNLRAGADVIVDIALPHTASFAQFRAKLDLRCHEVYTFLCGCTDEAVWIERWRKRLQNPAPNQYFKSAEEVTAHYANMEIALLPGEVFLDSCQGLPHLLQIVLKHIGKFKMNSGEKE